MKTVFACGHPYEPENEIKIGKGRIGCRQCRLVEKRNWRKRAREIAEEKSLPLKRGPKPEAMIVNVDAVSPEAAGSRMLLEAYAQYYERHVRRRAA